MPPQLFVVRGPDPEEVCVHESREDLLDRQRQPGRSVAPESDVVVSVVLGCLVGTSCSLERASHACQHRTRHRQALPQRCRPQREDQSSTARPHRELLGMDEILTNIAQRAQDGIDVLRARAGWPPSPPR